MDIKVYKKACTLTFEFDKGDNLYGFLLNKTSGDHSELEKFDKGYASYEVDKDGIFIFHLIESNNITITDTGFKIGSRDWTVEEYVQASNEDITSFLNTENLSTKTTFCACKLEKCLLNLQMKVFRELLKNCGKGCKSLDEIKSQRDFLFIANWIMKHLEEYDRFEELLEIYEGLRTCKSLCDDLLANNKCKCNG